MKHIIIDNKLYKLKAKDIKRLTLSTQTEITGYRGNKMQRFTSLDTDAILLEIVNNYKPIGDILGVFNI